jgi:hypothetical protein
VRAPLALLAAIVGGATLAGLGLYARSRPALPPASWLLGPVAVTVLTGLYTLGISPYTRPGQAWPLVPVLAGLGLVALWHVALLVRGPGRAVLLAYGVGHLAFWVYFALVCMLRISKDSP